MYKKSLYRTTTTTICAIDPNGQRQNRSEDDITMMTEGIQIRMQ